MRRLVFVLLSAALAWWAVVSFCGANGASAAAGPTVDLSSLIDRGGDAAAPASMDAAAPAGVPESTKPQPAVRTEPLAATVAAPAAAGVGEGTAAAESLQGADAEIERALASLMTKLEGGDGAARDQAMRLLGRQDLASVHRARLRTALGLDVSAVEDIDAVMRRLGENNSFLHSPEGRELGRRAVELLKTLPDERGVQIGTDLLERCMRGSIQRTDAQAIRFVDEAYQEHRVRADRVLCDPANLTRSRSYSVEKGDSLAAIAGRFRKEGLAIDETSLAALNRIHNMNAIRAGQRIRVPLDPIHAVLEKRSFLMALYLGDRILRLYWVGHGADGKTPVAEFTVSEKLKDPDWDAPDGRRIPFGNPENILGRYFVKFQHPSYTGFGAHGTPMPETIGTMSSMGCIRMLDADIEDLFKLMPRRAKVEVRDSH